MSYTVMARKWRPQIFDDVLGQNHVIETLRSAIVQERVGHAYLFSGPRGTGKTTTARLLAKALNCDLGPTPEPCGRCSFCQSIALGTSPDVREIDGASTGGVDDVRQLREEVGYAASKGKRKIYIIDEVHMLSGPAFNALLKTLEEPPGHVLFVFATTEPHKVPETVLSRCQRFNFRRIGAGDIVKQLRKIAESEHISFDETALFQIARKAEGGMRDALSMLDQVAAFGSAGVTDQGVHDLLGLIPRDLFFDLTEGIEHKDGSRVLRVVSRLVEEGGDFGEFVEGLMEHFRHLLVARATGELPGGDLPESDCARYVETAGRFEERDLLRMLQAISDLETRISRVAEPRFWLELTAMKLVQMTSSVELSELMGRLERLEVALRSGGAAPEKSQVPGAQKKNRDSNPPSPKKPATGGANPGLPKRSLEIAADPLPDAPPASGESDGQKPSSSSVFAFPLQDAPETAGEPAGEPLSLDALKQGWGRLVQEVKGRKISLGTFLAEGRLEAIEGAVALLVFPKSKTFHANQVRRNRAFVEEMAESVFGVGLRVDCKVDFGDDDQKTIEPALESNDKVQMVMQIFGGDVIR